MGPYTIKRLFIAGSIMQQAFPKPMAEFYGTMLAYDCIPLAAENPLYLWIHGFGLGEIVFKTNQASYP